MEMKEAISIVEVATGSYKGTREDHQKIIQALGMMKAKCKEEEKEESEEK